VSTIKCRACSPKDKSCPRCGGFKVLLQRIKCRCGHAYWDHIRRGQTVYDGKIYQAFDGTEITVHFDKTEYFGTCSFCPEET
jgi:hypothetical protein